MSKPVYVVIMTDSDGKECHFEGWLCEHRPADNSVLTSDFSPMPECLVLQPSLEYDPEGIKLFIPLRDVTMLYPTSPNPHIERIEIGVKDAEEFARGLLEELNK